MDPAKFYLFMRITDCLTAAEDSVTAGQESCSACHTHRTKHWNKTTNMFSTRSANQPLQFEAWLKVNYVVITLYITVRSRRKDWARPTVEPQSCLLRWRGAEHSPESDLQPAPGEAGLQPAQGEGTGQVRSYWSHTQVSPQWMQIFNKITVHWDHDISLRTQNPQYSCYVWTFLTHYYNYLKFEVFHK